MNIKRELADALLDHWPVARLSTVTESGRPHIVPAVFVRFREHVYLPVDGKAKRHSNLQRLSNVSANPHASLLLDHYAHDWSELWWMRIDGKADACDPEPALEQILTEKLQAKYPQYQTVPVSDARLPGGPVYLRIAIDRIHVWAQSQSEQSLQASLAALKKPSGSD